MEFGVKHSRKGQLLDDSGCNDHCTHIALHGLMEGFLRGVGKVLSVLIDKVGDVDSGVTHEGGRKEGCERSNDM
jgi:hypothetical protein